MASREEKRTGWSMRERPLVVAGGQSFGSSLVSMDLVRLPSTYYLHHTHTHTHTHGM